MKSIEKACLMAFAINHNDGQFACCLVNDQSNVFVGQFTKGDKSGCIKSLMSLETWLEQFGGRGRCRFLVTDVELTVHALVDWTSPPLWHFDMMCMSDYMRGLERARPELGFHHLPFVNAMLWQVGNGDLTFQVTNLAKFFEKVLLLPNREAYSLLVDKYNELGKDFEKLQREAAKKPEDSEMAIAR